MLARDFVLETLRQYNVEFLFGNPGTTELPLIDGLVNYPDIQFMVALHEDICVGMAAGYAHATGKPGVINLHATPGVAHGLGNIYDAYRAGIPLVVTAGQQDSRLAVEEPALAGDMVNMAKSCTKWSWEIKNVHELPVVLHRAFKVAMTEPMGPVLISFPSDIMWHDIQTKPIPLTIIPQEIRGDETAVQQAADLLRQASNPIFVSGDRIGRKKEALEQLVQLSELIGAQVYNEHLGSELNFPYTHPHYGGRFVPNGPFIANALAEADVVLFAGVMSQAPLLYYPNPLIPENAKFIAIDSGEWEIGKNMHVDVPIIGSPKSVLKEINDIIKIKATEENKKQFTFNCEKLLQEKKVKDKARQEELASVSNQTPISPIKVIDELDKIMPDNVFIVDESVTSSKYLHGYLNLDRPGSMISLKGGGLGYGITAALGAQLGRPEDRVVAVIGDGSSLYYIQSIWNAAKFNLPIIFVILNNTSYMILKGGILNIGGESAKKGTFIGMDLDEPAVDFVSVAKGFGIEALRVEKLEELRPAFEEAFKEKRPILLDILIDRTVKIHLK